MAWLIDDIDLSTLAWNIANRSAGWSVPAKRGDNLVIPGRNGTQWVPNKPFDEGTATLNMWALGSNPDGSMPDDGNLRRLCRANLDKLTAIFGQNSRLLNVVQIEGKAYGVQNLVTNPAFEKVGTTTQYTYQNSIPNPAGRKTASSGLLTNLFPNPEMVTYATPLWQPRYESIYPDPNHMFGGRGDTSFDLIGTSNYLYPSSFENNTSGIAPSVYNADTGVTLEVVDSTATDKTAQPYGGNRLLRATTTATMVAGSAIASRPDPFYVGTGHHPVVSFYVRRAAASITGTFNLRLRMFSYQADGVTRYNYSNIVSVPVPTSTTAWTLVRFAPTGGTWDTTGSPTDTVGFQILNDEQWPSGVSACFDQFNCNLWDTHIANASYQPSSFWAGKAGPFFNIDSVWGGLTGTSESTTLTRWMCNPDDRWIPDAATGATSPYYTFTDRPSSHSGGTSLNFHAMGWNAGVTQGFTMPLQNPSVGHIYGLRFRAKALSGKAITVKLQKQGLNETGRTTVASVSFTGAGSGTTAGSRMNGTVNSYEATSYYTAVSGDQMWVRVELPSSTDGYPIVQFTALQVNDSFGYFSGDGTNSSNSQYSWSGPAFNSKSIYSQKRVANFSSIGQAGVATSPLSGSSTLVNSIQAFCTADGQLTRAVSDPIALPSTQQGFFVGADLWGTYSNEARPTAHGLPQAQLLVELLNSSGLAVASAQSATVTLAAESAGVPTHLTAQITPNAVPASAATIRVTALMVNSFAGQYLEMLNLLVSPSAVDPTDVGAPAFFDGASPGGAWTGPANQSSSTYSAILPTRWTFGPGVGVPTAGGGVNVASAQTTSGAPQAVAKVPLLSVHSAAPYQVGLSITPQLLDPTGAVLGSGDVQVMVQLLDSSGTVQGTGTAGVFNASTAATGIAQPIQGMVTAAGSFSQVAFWFTGSTGTTLNVKINSAYLMPVTTAYNNPVQRLDFNLLYNSQFLLGATGWNLTNSVSRATPRGNGVSLTSSTSELSSEALPVSTVGSISSVVYGAWARKGSTDLTVAVRTGTRITNLLTNPLPTASFTPWVGSRVTSSYDATNRAMVGTINDATVATGAQRFGSSTTTLPNTHGAPPVTAGLPYSFACEVATNTGQPIYCWIQWYDASGTYLNLHADSAPITPGTSFTRITVANAVAPAGAAAAVILVGISGTGPRAVGQTISMRRAVFTQTTTAMPYFDGDTGATQLASVGWDGAAGASTSAALSYTVAASSIVTQTSYDTPVVGKATVPSSATHAQLVFTGAGGEVSSGYLAAPSGATVDDTSIDPDLYPYFDGGSASGGPYGEPVKWSGAADDSVSQVVPTFISGWGTPTTPTALVPEQSSKLAVTSTGSGSASVASGTQLPFTLPGTLDATSTSGGSGGSGGSSAGTGTLSTRPPGSSGAWAAIPRNITLSNPRTYRLNPAVSVGALGTFISGQLSLVVADGATVTVSLMQAANATAAGTAVWTSGPLASTGYSSVVSWLDVPVTAGSYVYVQLVYTETKHAAGQRVSFDNLLIMPTLNKIGGDYPGYFDGNTIGSAWDGDINASTSSYYGGGRRAYAEVRDAIDMTSMAGGTRAEFSVNLAIPGAFWEDLLQSNISLSVTNPQLMSNTQFPLSALAEGTAPIDDAVITVTPTGTVTGMVLTDVATGATLTLAGNVPSGGVTLNCGQFTAVAKTGGASVIRSISRAGSNGFLPLTPIDSTTPPTLAVKAASSSNGTLTISIQARRRYLIA